MTHTAKESLLEIGAKIITFGLGKNADLYPRNFSNDLNGITASLIYKKRAISVNTFFIGEYNLLNLMASIAAALGMGISADLIESSIQSLTPIPGRLEKISHRGKGTVFIDYAHTPDAYEKLLSNISKLSADNCQLSVVFGCGGNRDKSKRPQMAAIAEKYAEFVYLTTDNPRKESVEKILSETEAGFRGNNYIVLPDRSEAIKRALAKMVESSILLVLGKGRENYQEIGTEKISYSDVDTIEGFGSAD